jgi:tetratricopeptide (TPR) repeat protein
MKLTVRTPDLSTGERMTVGTLIFFLAFVGFAAATLFLPSWAVAAKKGYTYETDPIRLGMKALEEGRLEDAQTQFDEALQNEYQVPKAHFGLAEILRHQGSYADAEPLYRLSGTEIAMERGGSDFAERPAGLGLALLKLGRIDEAEGEFQKALVLKSGLWEARYGLARVALAKNDLVKAEKQLSDGSGVKGLKDGEDLYHYGMGLLLFQRERLEEAEKEALKAFTMNPNDPEYGTLVADVYTKRDAPTLAIEAYEKALAMPGAKPTARVLHSLGVLYQQEKRYNDAIAKYRESAQADSNFAPAWKDMGALYSLAKRNDEAARAYLRYAQIVPGDPEGLLGLAEACLKTKRYKQALDAAEKAYAKDSTKVEIRLSLARAAFLNKDKGRASAIYSTVTDTTMLAAEDYVRLGQFKLEAKDFEGAEKDFQSAITRDSTQAEADYYLGFVDLRNERNDMAVEHFKRAIAQAPDNAAFFLNMGIAQMRMKQNLEAAQSLREAVRLAPTSAQGHIFLAQALMMADSLGPAINEYQKARELEPENASALRGLGLGYLKRNSYGQAVDVLSRATEVDPNNADGWAWLGQALALLNRTPEALKALEKALAINPAHPSAKKLLDILKKAQSTQPAGTGK